MNADQGMQEFTYSFYAWNGWLAESEVVREAYDLNYPVFAAAPAHARRAGSLFQVDAPSVIVECVKPAEDGSRRRHRAPLRIQAHRRPLRAANVAAG